MKIEITQEDIDAAMAEPVFEGWWGEKCPVARALIRQGYKDVGVYPTWLYVEMGMRYHVPLKMQEYIANVDRSHNKLWLRDHPEAKVYPIVPATFTVRSLKDA